MTAGAASVVRRRLGTDWCNGSTRRLIRAEDPFDSGAVTRGPPRGGGRGKPGGVDRKRRRVNCIPLSQRRSRYVSRYYRVGHRTQR